MDLLNPLDRLADGTRHADARSLDSAARRALAPAEAERLCELLANPLELVVQSLGFGPVVVALRIVERPAQLVQPLAVLRLGLRVDRWTIGARHIACGSQLQRVDLSVLRAYQLGEVGHAARIFDASDGAV